MKRPRKPVGTAIIVADWKDTEDLLLQIKTALKARGLVLQTWSMGSDDWLVSIDDHRISRREFVANLNADMEDAQVEETRIGRGDRT